ncbi:MAG: hypothetical protein ACOY3Z_09140 [Thermodesulfobacteriota bacterium]
MQYKHADMEANKINNSAAIEEKRDMNRLRLIVHIGMNKTGSTSIQNTLSEAKDRLREQSGFFYDTEMDSSGFQNHYQLFVWAAKGDQNKIRTYLEQYVNMAMSFSARTAMLSSEEFFSLTSHPSLFHIFIESLQSLDHVDVELLLVVRPFSDWARSFLMQLVSNGAFCINEGFYEYELLASNIANGIRMLETCGVPISILPLSLGKNPGGLTNNVMRTLGFESAFEDRHDNATGTKRFFTAEFLSGLACGLRARLEGLHPNSPEIDKFRTKIRSIIDDRSQNNVVAEILDFYEQHIRYDVERLITKMVEKLSDADRQLFTKHGL